MRLPKLVRPGGLALLSKILMAITMALSAMGTPGTSADVFEAGGHYMALDDGKLTMWVESNGRPGLQTTQVVILGVVAVEPDTPALL